MVTFLLKPKPKLFSLTYFPFYLIASAVSEERSSNVPRVMELTDITFAGDLWSLYPLS